LEIIFSWWLILGAGMVVLGGRYYLHYFLILVPPLLFYLVDYLQRLRKKWHFSLAVFLCLFYPSVLFGCYWALVVPAWYSVIEPWSKPGGWLQSWHRALQTGDIPPDLKKDLATRQTPNGIWIADFKPEWYVRLDRRQATPYLNFQIAYHKMDWLEHNFKSPLLFSKPESPGLVFQHFFHESPDYIIDPLGIFGQMKNKMPLLLHPYRLRKVGDTDVYIRSGPVTLP
jgi:hypothetical protein